MLRAAGRLATGQGVATDILEASARAYVRALSNALEGAAIREAEAATAEAAVERTPAPKTSHIRETLRTTRAAEGGTVAPMPAETVSAPDIGGLRRTRRVGADGVAELGRTRQHGVVARRQLVEHGVGGRCR